MFNVPHSNGPNRIDEINITQTMEIKPKSNDPTTYISLRYVYNDKTISNRRKKNIYRIYVLAAKLIQIDMSRWE